MAMQGARASQGWVNKNCLDWLTIRPQDAAGGCAPMPKKLSELSDRMAEGTFRVNRTINEGMQKFYQQGIAKIVSLYNSELKGTVNSADAVIKAGKQYNTFTQVPDGMDGSVKFIYRTKVAD